MMSVKTIINQNHLIFWKMPLLMTIAMLFNSVIFECLILHFIFYQFKLFFIYIYNYRQHRLSYSIFFYYLC